MSIRVLAIGAGGVGTSAAPIALRRGVLDAQVIANSGETR